MYAQSPSSVNTQFSFFSLANPRITFLIKFELVLKWLHEDQFRHSFLPPKQAPNEPLFN